MVEPFSEAEMNRRWRLARDLMQRHGLIGLLIHGNSGVHRHNQANVFWLTDYMDWHHCYLFAPLDEEIEPVLWVGLANHVASAREVSFVRRVEWGGYHLSARIVEHLQRFGLTRGRLGLVGVNAKFGIGMPYTHYLHLRESLPHLELVDVTAEFVRLREVKSEEEIARLRRAAALTDQAIYALWEKIRPGIPDYALVEIAEGAFRGQGGTPHVTYIRAMPMDRPNGCAPAQNPIGRVIERGDVVLTEISASYGGYSGQIHRPLFVGADPSPAWQRLFEVALDAYRRIATALRPGACERDAVRAASVIGEAGYTIYDDLLHGFGIDIMPPLIDRSCAQYWPWDEARPAPEGQRFERNMAIVIQPNPITPDERMGLQLGALTLIREEGAVPLHQVPFEPLIVRI
ncbi:MAG TPA: M24 family metallopeptidase [Thermoflexus sp.]|nr:M24 family metallopeptidase [Thermoflexus sp.]